MTEVPGSQDDALPDCGCIRCLDADWRMPEITALTTIADLIPPSRRRMVGCQTCGNKRCPHANDHRNICTNSNDTGQPGSAYP